MDKKNPYKILLETFGEDAQYRCAIEEMSELTKAICKYQRKKIAKDKKELQKAKENLQEEIADVIINMEELCYMFDGKKIEEIKKMKLARAMKRAELNDMEYKGKEEENE